VIEQPAGQHKPTPAALAAELGLIGGFCSVQGDLAQQHTQLHRDPCRASRLAAIGLLAPGQMQRIEHPWWFGCLIANTDMHTTGCAAALSFWKLAARDTRISEGLRRISGLNARRLQQVAERV
jgi:hypothetical protein